jgi:EmrB/QacA subfamily drug resistance transporter
MADSVEGRRSYKVTFVVLGAGVSTYSLLSSLLFPMLATFQRVLHTSQTNVTWMMTAFLLSSSISTPILGRLGDMTGKKRMFVIGLISMGVGTLLGGFATSLGVMIVARVLQGTAGGLLPLAFGIARDEFPPEKVAGTVSTLAALVAVGGGAGVALAGPIDNAFGYRWLFWFPLIITVMAALAAYLVIPESRERTTGRISWAAVFLLSGWLVALLVGISRAPAWGWGSGRVLGLIALAAVGCALWIVAETRARTPLIDMRMMRIRAVWTSNLVALLFGIGIYSMIAFLPGFVETPRSNGYGFSSSITEAGAMLLPLTLGMLFFGIVAGPLGARYGSRNVVLGGSILSALSVLALALEHDTIGAVLIEMSTVGVGFGFAFSGLANLVVAAVPPTQTGVASGMNANIRTIGGSIGTALMASIITTGVAGGFPRESGYTKGFMALAIALGLAALAALLIPNPRRDPRTGREPDVALRHAELAIVPGGTLVGDEPE